MTQVDVYRQDVAAGPAHSSAADSAQAPTPVRDRLGARISKAARLVLSNREYLGMGLRLLAGCVSRKGRMEFGRCLRGIHLEPLSAKGYAAWRASAVKGRDRFYPLQVEPGVFSILTTVFNTPVAYLERLAESLFQQTWTEFEWVLLENGSKDPETLAAVERIARDPRVRLERVADNLGIVGGMRSCLERATGRYVVPLDSDDILTPDALQILGAEIARLDGPPLLYSDEDKVRDDEVPFEGYIKPDWDPVLFWNSCYIAHLCAIRRDLGLEFGIYSDSRADGCHDWDSFFRFLRHGHEPVHVPEMLYAWRIHGASCAGNIFSKDYIFASHEHVLEREVAALPSDAVEKFQLQLSPLFAGTPDWWVRRQRVDPVPLATLSLRAGGPEIRLNVPEPGPEAGLDGRSPRHGLKQAVASLQRQGWPDDGLVLIYHPDLKLQDDEWPWELAGMFERFPDTGLAGGLLMDEDRRVFSAGDVIGFGGHLVGRPDFGAHVETPGYFAWLKKQRSVGALSAAFAVIRMDVLAAAADQLPLKGLYLLGAGLSAVARRMGRRCVFTPLTRAVVPADQTRILAPERAPESDRQIVSGLLPDPPVDPCYPRWLALEPGKAYMLRDPAEVRG